MNANENHRANIEKAFTEYLDSSYFSGHVYPGHFYDFCANDDVYRQVNNTLCNRVQLSVQDLAIRANTSFRKLGPSESTYQKAKYYLNIALTCATIGGDINNNIKTKLGDKYGDFGRYMPLRTVKYFYDIGFCIDELPRLTRGDYSKFFKKMQDEKYTQASEYIVHMRNNAIPLAQRETIEIDQAGFLYCFISNFKAQAKGYCVVKVGRTKKAIERVLSHKSAMPDHQIVYLSYTPSSLTNEKKLIEYFENSRLSRPFYDPKSKRRSYEMFELPAMYAAKMFDDFIADLKV